MDSFAGNTTRQARRAIIMLTAALAFATLIGQGLTFCFPRPGIALDPMNYELGYTPLPPTGTTWPKERKPNLRPWYSVYPIPSPELVLNLSLCLGRSL
jgi:hypothetical protein